MEQGGLARAGLADQGEHFAAADFEVDGIEDDQVGVAGAVDFGELFGAEGDVARGGGHAASVAGVGRRHAPPPYLGGAASRGDRRTPDLAAPGVSRISGAPICAPMPRCAMVARVILKARSRSMEVQFTPEVQAKL